MKFNKLLVIDFEATCWDDSIKVQNDTQEGKFQEIIECGIACISMRDKCKYDPYIIENRSILVKPVVEPVLSDYCTKLTGITQDRIDYAGTFPIFCEEIQKYHSWFWASWGAWDRNIMESNCKYWNIPNPLNRKHLDIKLLYSIITGFDIKSINEALIGLNMEFQGDPHRAKDDAYNAARILMRLMSITRNLFKGITISQWK